MNAGRSGAFVPIEGRGAVKEARPRGEWKVIVPVPDNAPEPMSKHYKLGLASAHYEYRDQQGRLLGLVFRFAGADGRKSFIPQTWCRHTHTGETAWRWKSWERPRPLYGLDRLADAPGAVVVVCEGEKAANAAEELLPKQIAVTAPGGSKAAKSADWSPLTERSVVIWPDNDAPGRTYAARGGHRAPPC